MIAASAKHVDVVRLLAKHGADLNALCSADGQTALYRACELGDVATATLLVELGA